MKNKDYKKRFILVNSNDIKRPIYIVKREFSFNDFDNVYYKTVEESLDSIFDLYEIPREYRIIALKINTPWTFTTILEDYLTKVGYDITATKKQDNLFVEGNTLDRNFYDRIYFKAFPRIVNYSELIELYKKMQDEGILTNYINAISNIYKINIRSENIEKYNSVMSSYRSGEYGEDNLTIAQILEMANEKKLIERMTIPELQNLSSNSSGITKLFFAEEIKKRLDENINDAKEKGKVKSLKK